MKEKQDPINLHAFASLLAGVVCLILSLVTFHYLLAIGIGIFGLIFGVLTLRRKSSIEKIDRQFAIWGVILSAIGMILPLLLFLWLLLHLL